MIYDIIVDVLHDCNGKLKCHDEIVIGACNKAKSDQVKVSDTLKGKQMLQTLAHRLMDFLQ